MHEAVRDMLARYECRSRDDYVNALREILQDVALLGLWRSKFFEHAAFYGGSALRLLHRMDRFSEDLDFSLLQSDQAFSLGKYGEALCREMRGFGFSVVFEALKQTRTGAIESAFLKTHMQRELISSGVAEQLLRDLHPAKYLKIKLEVDTDPPGGFETETHYVLHPMPFPVRAFSLPDLFAGKLHAILRSKWKSRVKGRDWYDLVWYIARHPQVRLAHLESRMRHSGDYTGDEKLESEKLQALLRQAVEDLDIENARREVSPFIADQRALDIWSKEFFLEIVTRIVPI